MYASIASQSARFTQAAWQALTPSHFAAGPGLLRAGDPAGSRHSTTWAAATLQSSPAAQPALERASTTSARRLPASVLLKVIVLVPRRCAGALRCERLVAEPATIRKSGRAASTTMTPGRRATQLVEASGGIHRRGVARRQLFAVVERYAVGLCQHRRIEPRWRTKSA